MWICLCGGKGTANYQIFCGPPTPPILFILLSPVISVVFYSTNSKQSRLCRPADEYLKEFVSRNNVCHISLAFPAPVDLTLSSCPVENNDHLGDCFVSFPFFKLISIHNGKITDITSLPKVASLHS